MWSPFVIAALVLGLGACTPKKSKAGDSNEVYRQDLANSSSQLISGTKQDRWESALYFMIHRDSPMSQDMIRSQCELPQRLERVPLQKGQSLAPGAEFKIYREGRTCYDHGSGGGCQRWNYHGVYSCLYYIDKDIADTVHVGVAKP